MTQPASNGQQEFSNILLQTVFEDPQKIRKKETGAEIAKAIYSQQTSSEGGGSSFFSSRAAKWNDIESWAEGTQDMSQFRDYFNVSDGNKAYVKLDETPIKIGNQFVGTLIGSMAKNVGYPSVRAIDRLSLKEKSKLFGEALFRMKELKTINAMQEQMGGLLENPNAYVPDDELSAMVHYELEDRLPKEARFEGNLIDFMADNDYEDGYKLAALRTLIVNNIECNKIERYPDGRYYMRTVKPKNLIYNYISSDNGKLELGYIGETYNMKIKDIRKRFGVNAGIKNGVTEKEIYEMAKMSSQSTKKAFNYQWDDRFSNNSESQWDEHSVTVFDFEYQICETEYHVSKKDNYGNENITRKKGIPKVESEKSTVIKKAKNSWLRGIYCPCTDKMIYWGDTDLKIFPFRNHYQGLSSYSIAIPNNNGKNVVSLFERALEPLMEYALLKMKRKQLISKIRPSGIRIDVESARNTGIGGDLPWEEVIRIYDQTGNEIYSSRGVNPNEREGAAISNMPKDDSVQKVLELSAIMDGVMMEIRGLLGVPIYRDGSDVGDRTAARLAEGQNKSSFNVTDFILTAHYQCLKETLYKICLLKWQDAIKEEPESDEDLINTVFDVRVEMKATEYERELLERDIAAWSQIVGGNGYPLISPKDALKIRSIKVYKSQILYLDSVLKNSRKRDEDFKTMLQDKNIQDQRESAEAAKNGEIELEKIKLKSQKEIEELRGRNEKENTLLDKGLEIVKIMVTPRTTKEGEVAATTPQIPNELQDALTKAIQSVTLSLTRETAKTQDEIQEDEEQRQVEAQQKQMAMMQQQQEAEAMNNRTNQVMQ